MKHDVAELLPFYANGTLDAAERARVEAELAACETCAGELRELETLASSLKAHAAAAPPLPPHLIDDVLARVATPPATAAVTKLRTAWWGTPARYATAAALVVGVGAAGMAAWQVREADIARNTQGSAVTAQDRTTTIFRVTPGPNNASTVHRAAKVAAPVAGNPAAAPAEANAPVPAPAVAKQHRLAKKARIELLVRDVEASLKQVQSVVRAAGGDVVALADSSPRATEAVHGATLDVEIPADRLDDTLDHLGLLGTVQNRAIDAEDLDASIVDEEARLRNLRRAETDLRKLMDKGGKVDEILTVQQNLGEVRGQIEQLDAQHKHDLHRVATSTVTVTLTEDRPNATPAKPGPTARIDGAWHSGINALSDTVVSLLSAVVWCVAYAPVPLGLAGITYAATRLLRGRTASA
jgi:anti-sigma factor ChrR (cupin superfamily)